MPSPRRQLYASRARRRSLRALPPQCRINPAVTHLPAQASRADAGRERGGRSRRRQRGSHAAVCRQSFIPVRRVAFLERFGEAAQAGFRGVECLFPYEAPAADIADRLRQHRLEFVLLNAPPGEWAAGERGIASLPGREHEFQAGFVTALRYAKALRCRRIHVMAGLVPDGADASGARASVRCSCATCVSPVPRRSRRT